MVVEDDGVTAARVQEALDALVREAVGDSPRLAMARAVREYESYRPRGSAGTTGRIAASSPSTRVVRVSIKVRVV